ncbi:MAG: hypothetical protein GKS06_12585 [Acidobacteria bacterium]|nr:hypothetical protein [Acidobacteriota bacterium]
MTEVTSIHDHATGHLRVIRDAMERAGAFTALPGWAGVGMALVAFVAGVGSAGAEPRDWVVTWLIAAAVAVPLGAVTLAYRASSAGVDLSTGVARRFVVTLSAPVVAGGVLTAAMILRDQFDLLPAVWLTLYGTGMLVASSYSTRLLQVAGAAVMALGAVAAFVPWEASTWLVVAGFGGMHLLTGLIVLVLDRRNS